MKTSFLTSLIGFSSAKSGPLVGKTSVPGDKSISHRALILSSQAIGTSIIEGLLLGEDILHTASALRALGVEISTQDDGKWMIHGVGIGGFKEPEDIINMGNSGTGVRLMMGLVTPYPFTTFFTGDSSLRKRPMARVTTPLIAMGASIVARNKNQLPIAFTGSDNPLPISYHLPIPSAQVKSAILLAGLGTPGKTTVIESEATRNHTELMLRYFGAEMALETDKGNSIMTLTGRPYLEARHIVVPSDPSSAAFLAVAALIIPGSDLLITNVCINPLRIGLYVTLQEMGGDIQFLNKRTVAGEEIADIRICHSPLKGVKVPAERAPSMIDEYPILAIAASVAQGNTEMLGLAELKVRESNRLKAIAEGLEACGIPLNEGEDSLIVTGKGGKVPGGGYVTTYMDHRIAMSFLILGTISEKPVTVDDGTMINTSFPGFIALLNSLGGNINGL